MYFDYKFFGHIRTFFFPHLATRLRLGPEEPPVIGCAINFLFAKARYEQNSFSCINNIQFILPKLNNAMKTFTNEHLIDIPRIISHKGTFKKRNAPYCSSLSSKRCAVPRIVPHYLPKSCVIPRIVPHYLPKDAQCPILFLTIFQKMRNGPYCSSLSSKLCAMPHIVPHYLPKNAQCPIVFLIIFPKKRNAP